MSTFNDIDEIRGILQQNTHLLNGADQVGEFRGEYQRGYVHNIVDNTFSINKGPCQHSGKTWAGCLAACDALLKGRRGCTAFPTLRQGGRVLIRRLSAWMTILENHYNIKRSMPDGSLEKTWDNGAILCALSTNEGATAGIQGYTFDFIMVDEGHEVTADTIIGPLFSRAEIALMEGHGWINIAGVGGGDLSAIEYCQTLLDENEKPEFSLNWSKPADIIADVAPDMTEKVTKAFARAERMNSPAHWRKFYLCEPSREGESRVMPNIVPFAEYSQSVTPALSIGIDVGKIVDDTIIQVLEFGPHVSIPGRNAKNLLATYRLPKNLKTREQSELIREFVTPFLPRLRSPSSMVVEENGPGLALFEYIQEWYPQVSSIWMSDDTKNRGLKSWIIMDIQRDAAQDALGIADREERSIFTNLKYVTDEKGRMIWDHSDELSALICAYSCINI